MSAFQSRTFRLRSEGQRQVPASLRVNLCRTHPGFLLNMQLSFAPEAPNLFGDVTQALKG